MLVNDCIDRDESEENAVCQISHDHIARPGVEASSKTGPAGTESKEGHQQVTMKSRAKEL